MGLFREIQSANCSLGVDEFKPIYSYCNYYFAITRFVCFLKNYFFFFPAFLFLCYIMSTRVKLHEEEFVRVLKS